eukprot:765218-Hanusia_phi.AAC.2
MAPRAKARRQGWGVRKLILSLLLLYPLMAVVFHYRHASHPSDAARQTAAQIDAGRAATLPAAPMAAPTSKEKAPVPPVGCGNGIFTRDLSWIGPYYPLYMTGGVSLQKMVSTLKAAQTKCEQLSGCEGITGYWTPASMPELEWQWDLRGRDAERNEVWVQPSKVHEVSYVYNRNLSKMEKCCPKSFRSMPPIFYINLQYRSDRRENLLSHLAARGVDIVRDVVRQNGVDRSRFSNATEIVMKLEGLPVSEMQFWSHYKVQGKLPDIQSNLYKGRIASWEAHRLVWKRIQNNRNHHQWYIIVEDDVKMIDDVKTLLEKLSLTTCLHPSVDIIYLTGRQVPKFLPGNIVQYLGVDAYVVSSRVIKALLDHTVLGDFNINSLAIDTYLSNLIKRGVIDARMIEGGNAFVNSWKEFRSDIQVTDKP